MTVLWTLLLGRPSLEGKEADLLSERCDSCHAARGRICLGERGLGDPGTPPSGGQLY